MGDRNSDINEGEREARISLSSVENITGDDLSYADDVFMQDISDELPTSTELFERTKFFVSSS